MYPRRWRPIVLGLMAFFCGHAPGQDTAGKRLAAALDAMDVEHKWLARGYVKWETGESLEKPVTDGKSHTHCSAFVAAAGKKLGVYILRPPEHKLTQLANAQYDWLVEEGKKRDWQPVKSATEAQRRANEGQLVVAAYKEPGDTNPGHIAIVRPSAKGDRDIGREGPQIIQAGKENYNSTSLKEGFKHHPAAWRDRQVRYFAHEVKWE